MMSKIYTALKLTLIMYNKGFYISSDLDHIMLYAVGEVLFL